MQALNGQCGHLTIRWWTQHYKDIGSNGRKKTSDRSPQQVKKLSQTYSDLGKLY